jgi:hypothetical protein
MSFYCKKCDLVFENQSPEKNEYTDPVFGNCWNYFAGCPECGEMCSEKQEMKNSRKSGAAVPSYPQNFCGQGGCCCN